MKQHRRDTDSNYKCCCRRLHVEDGTMCLAIFIGAITAVHLTATFMAPRGYGGDAATNECELFLMYSIQLAFCALVVCGIRRKQPMLLLPFAFKMALSLAACLLGAAAFGAGSVQPRSTGESLLDRIVGHARLNEYLDVNFEPLEHYLVIRLICLFVSIALLLGGALSYWWLTVTLECRRYIIEVRRFNVEAGLFDSKKSDDFKKPPEYMA